MPVVICADVGSTRTKVAVVDVDAARLLGTGEQPTTAGPGMDVLDGLAAARSAAEAASGLTAAPSRAAEVLVCSSAGGGLRMAVVGYQREVTAEAGRRAALSAGGRVVHVHAGPLDAASIGALRAATPDVVLLTGGTDGGNGDVLLHNARRLGIARLPATVVLAGNQDAAETAADELRARGRRVIVTGNVLPRVGQLNPGPARAAIRAAFLAHVIGGKGLSPGPTFGRLVRATTPDAVLTGVQMLAVGAPGVPGAGDVLVVDVGGATTDVYSVLIPDGPTGDTRAEARAAPAGLELAARSVEADLGVRWSALDLVTAARADRISVPDPLARYAALVAADPRRLPSTATEAGHDRQLAAAAVLLAVRRHGRAGSPAETPRPLREVRLLVGSGGVLRHTPAAAALLAPLLEDHGGGWAVPARAAVAVDSRYVLFAAGLLSEMSPGAAARLAGSLRDAD